jgi:hypothetical protein
MGQAGSRPPRLIALLIDLPDRQRAALAAAWGVGGDGAAGTVGDRSGALAPALYGAMVDPARLGARVAGLDPGCRDVLRALGNRATGLDDLLGRVALGGETVERCLGQLGQLCLVVRLDARGRPRPAAPPFGGAELVVPREVAASLRGLGALH